MMTTATIPAGWYADPAHQHEYRYWDGTQWTVHVSDHGTVVTEAATPWAPAVPAQRAAAATTAAPASSPDLARVAALVDEAVATIEANATINADGTFVVFGGSESPVMDAANKLREAVELQPDDPWLRFAWISALATAAQWKDARERLAELVAARPDFLPARFAHEGAEKWTPLFLLPPWTRATTDPHPRLRSFVKGRVILATRDRILPRATFFLRDVNGEFDADKLRSARIDLATVVSPVATTPQVVAMYVRVWDDPANPYGIEVVAVPFSPRGSLDRAGYEYLCIEPELDLVILGTDDQVLLNRRVLVPPGVRATHQQLLARFLADNGSDISRDAAIQACRLHSSSYSLADVPYEETSTAPVG